MNRQSIWNEAQNKPTLIARDLLHEGIPPAVTYEILLRRGVFKWFAVRRDLIRLKDALREKIRCTLEDPEALDRHKEWIRGYRAGLEEARAEIRRMCHSDRWQAPDNDREAQRWLEGRGMP